MIELNDIDIFNNKAFFYIALYVQVNL